MENIPNKFFFEKLSKKYSIEVFILFGSYAENSQQSYSDIDIAYIAQKKLSSQKKKELYIEISKQCNDKSIDLIELNTSDSILLQYEIFEKGICLFETKEGLFEDFAGDAWVQYQENKEYYSQYAEIISKSINSI